MVSMLRAVTLPMAQPASHAHQGGCNDISLDAAGDTYCHPWQRPVRSRRRSGNEHRSALPPVTPGDGDRAGMRREAAREGLRGEHQMQRHGRSAEIAHALRRALHLLRLAPAPLRAHDSSLELEMTERLEREIGE